MAKDTTTLPADNVFKESATISDVARVIGRLMAQGANFAGTLSETWAVDDANKQNSLYNMITNGMNSIALDMQEWTALP